MTIRINLTYCTIMHYVKHSAVCFACLSDSINSTACRLIQPVTMSGSCITVEVQQQHFHQFSSETVLPLKARSFLSFFQIL